MTMVNFVFNLSSPKIRRESLEGKTHLVVPTVMLVEGVHNGSEGPFLYQSDEIGKDTDSWNHMPVVVYHPKQNGKYVSARDPIVLNTRKIGILLNTKFEDKKLKTEAWIDEERVKTIDNRIYEAILNNQKVEVSTGLSVEVVKEEGKWNEESYIGIVRNFRPDHLAVLPDQIGACSVADGAGLLANEQGPMAIVNPIVQNADTSSDNLMRSVSSAVYDLYRKPGYSWNGWIADVFNSFVIVYNEGGYYKIEYSIKDGVVELESDPVKVYRKIVYRESDSGNLVGNSESDNWKEIVMAFNKAEHLQNLIGNGFEEKDREWLDKLSEEQLAKIQPVTKQQSEVPVANQQPAPTQQSSVVSSVPTWADFVKTAPAEFHQVLNDMTSVYTTEKTRLVDAIVANANSPYSKEELVAMDVTNLRKLATLAGVDVNPQQSPVNNPFAQFYQAAAGYAPPVFAANTDKEGLSLPDFPLAPTTKRS